jgi:surface protein
MKQAKLLFLLMLLVPMCGQAAEQGYAVFDPATGTLTFSYGEKPAGEYVYDTDNTGEFGPSWTEKLRKVVFESSFAKARPRTTKWWFVAASELIVIDGLQNLNTSQVVNMLGMFDGCSSLTSLDVSHFDTSNVTDMANMFCDCSALTSLDVSHFDTGNVEDMRGMFSGCSGLTSLDLSSFNTHYVACNARDDMFLGCNSLQTIYVGENWDLECINYPQNIKVVLAGEVVNKEQGYAVFDPTTGTLTFRYGQKPSGNYVYDTDDTGDWPIWSNKNLKKVVFDESFAKTRPQSVRAWFSGATELMEIEGLEYLNISRGISMVNMFYGCSSLTSIDLSHFDTSSIKYMASMFAGCSSLTSLDLSHFDTSKLEDCSEMFSGCSALTSVDLRYFNSRHLGHCRKMFSGCSSLTSLDLRSFNTYRASMDDMFTGCDNLKTVYIGDDWRLEGMTYPSDLELVVSKKRGFAVYDPDTGTMTFKYGDRLSGKKLYFTDYYFDDDQDWPTWKNHEFGCTIKKAVFDPSFAEARPKTTRGWFALGGDYLTEIEGIEYLNTSEVIDMSLMFMEQRVLTSIDLSHFDTSKVLNMDSMFESCSGLTSLDLSHFDTSNVINMRDMFIACTNLTYLDLSSFDT